MINMANLNYASVYSFEPSFLREITEDEAPHALEELATYHLDKTDILISGILATVIFILLFGMIFSVVT